MNQLKLPTTINYNNTNDIINEPIHYYEIRNCIVELDKNKAHGPDLIHDQMLINGRPNLWNHLQIVFNKCLTQGIYPQQWNYANVHPMPKTRQNSLKPKELPPHCG